MVDSEKKNSLMFCVVILLYPPITPCPLSISTERHRAEVRRAVNDERLTTIAYQ